MDGLVSTTPLVKQWTRGGLTPDTYAQPGPLLSLYSPSQPSESPLAHFCRCWWLRWRLGEKWELEASLAISFRISLAKDLRQC